MYCIYFMGTQLLPYCALNPLATNIYIFSDGIVSPLKKLNIFDLSFQGIPRTKKSLLLNTLPCQAILKLSKGYRWVSGVAH